jgi:hypothetical protein
MEGIPLKRSRRDTYETDFNKCILCQKDTRLEPTSTEQGRKRILEAARIRDDIVNQRLTQGGSSHFVYHVSNDCYKKYTLKQTLEKIVERKTSSINTEHIEAENDQTPGSENPSRSSRSQSTPREPPCAAHIDFYKKVCVVCGQIKYKGDCEKFRMSECERAEKFLQATVYFQDEVYTRTCDLQDIQSVFGADLFCHKNCIKLYLLRYERTMQKSCRQVQLSPKLKAFHELVANIDPALSRGEGYSISNLKEQANQLAGVDSPFTNRELKVLLCSHYGDRLHISTPREANKSAMVFLNTVTPEDMADTIRATDPIISCANTIR